MGSDGGRWRVFVDREVGQSTEVRIGGKWWLLAVKVRQWKWVVVVEAVIALVRNG